jgi:Holliday junction resolvase RusA-like endonuclease
MRQAVRIESWLPTMSANGSHGHWSTQRKKHQIDSETVWASAKFAGWKVFPGKVRVTITLHFATRRRRDTDNLYARVKGCVDGIKQFCTDDSSEWMELRVAEQPPLPGIVARKCTEICMETLP